jgi:ATP-dependent 26S proteasome regulatory subunit
MTQETIAQLTIDSQKARIAALEIKLEAAKREGAQAPQALQDELAEQKKAFEEVSKMLQEMQVAPKTFGLILRINKPLGPNEEVKPEHFVSGMSVRLKSAGDAPITVPPPTATPQATAQQDGQQPQPEEEQQPQAAPTSEGVIISKCTENPELVRVFWPGSDDANGLKDHNISELELITAPTAVLRTQSGPVEVPYNEALGLKVGMNVRLVGNVILGASPWINAGQIVSVRRIIEPGLVEVTSHGNPLTVIHGNIEPAIEEGCRVVLDSASQVVLKNLGKPPSPVKSAGATKVHFSDIGGNAVAKEALTEAVVDPRKFGALYTKFARKPSKGVLLWGPPGCGKTLIAKALATEVAAINGGEGAESAFIYVKAPELLVKWVGDSEAAIRELFASARDHKDKHGYPAIIFIDEADAIMAKRGSRVSSDMENTIVPSFLTEMDGLLEAGAFVILATNRPDILDPAVVRDGRIDRKIEVKRPDFDAMIQILGIHSRNIPFKDWTAEEAVQHAAQEIQTNKAYTYYKVSFEGDNQPKGFGLKHIVNGAMLEAVMQQAVTNAMERCKASNNLTGEDEGVTKADIDHALKNIFEENAQFDHEDPLNDMVRDSDGKLIGYTRVKQATS